MFLGHTNQKLCESADVIEINQYKIYDLKKSIEIEILNKFLNLLSMNFDNSGHTTASNPLHIEHNNNNVSLYMCI